MLKGIFNLFLLLLHRITDDNKKSCEIYTFYMEKHRFWLFWIRWIFYI